MNRVTCALGALHISSIISTKKHFDSSSNTGLEETLKILSLTLMFMTETSSTPNLQLMVALAMAIKGRPKIIEICFEACLGSMSNTTKSIEKKNIYQFEPRYHLSTP